MRKGFWWVMAVIIAGLFYQAGQREDYLATLPDESEKTAITVYAPEDMETAFKSALRVANLHETHKIVMIDDENDANICVGYGKQDDENYQMMAFSPFVVAYNTSDSCNEKLKETKVFVPSPYDKDCYEIDFLKIINEAIGQGKWANLNLEDENELKVFYPSEESIYWNDFHDFLLVTVNNGYPKTEKQMENAEKIIKKFLDSKYTEGVNNFYEQVQRTGGFPSSAIYILTEKEALDICSAQSEYANIYYPTNTVYFNYYIKADEVGKQIIDVLNERKKGFMIFKEDFYLIHDFYLALAEKRYRNNQYTGLRSSTDYAYYERDMYNVAKITEIVEATIPHISETEPDVSTEATSPTSE